MFGFSTYATKDWISGGQGPFKAIFSHSIRFIYFMNSNKHNFHFGNLIFIVQFCLTFNNGKLNLCFPSLVFP